MTKEEIKKEIAECEEKLANLREKLDKPEYGGKRWKPKKNEEYYHIYPNGKIDRFFFDSGYDANVCTQGNCFKTKEEAEFEVERRKVIAELSDYAEGDEAVWDGTTGHWQIYYSFLFNRLSYNICFTRTETLYFPSREAAEAAVKAVGEDRVKKYYLRIKED